MINGNFGIANRFKKNHIPFNTGKKWNDFMSEQSKSNSLKTTFKKGNKPPNTLHDGIITYRADSKTKRVYKHIRISLGKWQMLHVYNWEQINGKLPKGKILAFIGSTEDCSVGNLMLITRAENMKRNRDIVMIAVKECGMALRFANRFKCDKEIVLEAIKSHSYAFIFINDCFLHDSGDRDIMRTIEQSLYNKRKNNNLDFRIRF